MPSISEVFQGGSRGITSDIGGIVSYAEIFVLMSEIFYKNGIW